MVGRNKIIVTHNVHVGHKVSKECAGDDECPDDVLRVLPVVHIDDLPPPALVLLFTTLLVSRHQLLEGERGQHHDEDEAGEEAEGVGKADRPDESLEDVRHGEGEDGAAGSDDAVDDTEATAEVVAQDGQGGNVRQRASGAEHHTVSEAQGANLGGKVQDFTTILAMRKWPYLTPAFSKWLLLKAVAFSSNQYLGCWARVVATFTVGWICRG